MFLCKLKFLFLQHKCPRVQLLSHMGTVYLICKQNKIKQKKTCQTVFQNRSDQVLNIVFAKNRIPLCKRKDDLEKCDPPAFKHCVLGDLNWWQPPISHPSLGVSECRHANVCLENVTHELACRYQVDVFRNLFKGRIKFTNGSVKSMKPHLC
jgi:hypothetical protein